VRIGCLQIPEVLNHNERVCYSVRPSFEYVQVRERRTRSQTDADKPGRSLSPQAKFSGQRGIDSVDLGACIHQKVVGAERLSATGTTIWERRTSVGVANERPENHLAALTTLPPQINASFRCDKA
jgi:hypothetical protein